MKLTQDAYDVGVIVGRFQVHELHEGHRNLIQYVCDQHEKVIILLGVSPLWGTLQNPLDFEARKQMISEEFPQVNILYVKDQHDDDLWSRKLDAQVRGLLTPSQTAVLYGSRDSFIPYYSGKFPARELEGSPVLSGSAVRRKIQAASTRPSPEFRAGAIWAASTRYPTAFTTVDVAILRGDELLLGRKINEPKLRFVGGFSDPSSPSFEADAKREVAEETGLEVADVRYVGSRLVDDWRYRGEVDKIKTILFTARYVFGQPRAADDLFAVEWKRLDLLTPNDLMPEHRPLLELLNSHLEA